MQALTYAPVRRTTAAGSGTGPQISCGPSTPSLDQAILALPEKQRVILCLFYFERLALDQIAEVLGASEQALSAEFHRATEQLRRAGIAISGVAAA